MQQQQLAGGAVVYRLGSFLLAAERDQRVCRGLSSSLVSDIYYGVCEWAGWGVITMWEASWCGA